MRAHILKTVEQIVLTYDIGAVLFHDDNHCLSTTDNSNRHITSRII